MPRRKGAAKIRVPDARRPALAAPLLVRALERETRGTSGWPAVEDGSRPPLAPAAKLAFSQASREMPT
ncbi:hypothetical protein SCE1572_06825 [Sorangium cellulosum So0157-2]|uniref:Uncharacterized protein n=1 Tax=Sorangium cellulosum So0157-2 TaxID=1254432 RepID=S4XP81_SORCE|nr:hypothetical protein SCE1572_06825 [Sorangium cellulosum So0157-2]